MKRTLLPFGNHFLRVSSAALLLAGLLLALAAATALTLSLRASTEPSGSIIRPDSALKGHCLSHFWTPEGYTTHRALDAYFPDCWHYPEADICFRYLGIVDGQSQWIVDPVADAAETVCVQNGLPTYRVQPTSSSSQPEKRTCCLCQYENLDTEDLCKTIKDENTCTYAWEDCAWDDNTKSCYNSKQHNIDSCDKWLADPAQKDCDKKLSTNDSVSLDGEQMKSFVAQCTEVRYMLKADSYIDSRIKRKDCGDLAERARLCINCVGLECREINMEYEVCEVFSNVQEARWKIGEVRAFLQRGKQTPSTTVWPDLRVRVRALQADRNSDTGCSPHITYEMTIEKMSERFSPCHHNDRGTCSPEDPPNPTLCTDERGDVGREVCCFVEGENEGAPTAWVRGVRCPSPGDVPGREGTISCNSAEDCPEGEWCGQDARCHYYCDPVNNGWDCPSGWCGEDFQCHDACDPYGDNSDCPADYWCGRDAQCHAECDPNGDDAYCPPDEWCGQDTVCHDSCDPFFGNGEDCPAGYHCGEDDQCHISSDPCFSDDFCPVDEWCGRDTQCHAECDPNGNSEDCPEGEWCGEDSVCHRSCDPINGGWDCPADYWCGEDSVCHDACDPYGNGEDCPEGEWCGQNGYCYNSCDPVNDDWDCPPDEWCGEGTAVCHRSCDPVNGGWDCPPDEWCGQGDSQCHSPSDPCSSDDECFVGYWCGGDGQCHDFCDPVNDGWVSCLAGYHCGQDTQCHISSDPCFSDDFCPADEWCGQDYQCHNFCSENDDCGVEGEWCGQDAQCRSLFDPCSNNDECPTGYYWCGQDSQCYNSCDPINDGWDCPADEWCGEDYQCHNSSDPCVTNDNCRAGEWCGVDTQCHNSCSTDDNCQSGYWCGRDTQCHAECDPSGNNEDCPAGYWCDQSSACLNQCPDGYYFDGSGCVQ